MSYRLDYGLLVPGGVDDHEGEMDERPAGGAGREVVVPERLVGRPVYVHSYQTRWRGLTPAKQRWVGSPRFS